MADETTVIEPTTESRPVIKGAEAEQIQRELRERFGLPKIKRDEKPSVEPVKKEESPAEPEAPEVEALEPEEEDPEPEPEPEPAPVVVAETKPEPAPEPTPEPPKGKTYTDEEVDAMLNDRVQRAVNAVVAKERQREEAATRKLRDLEVATGKPFEQLLAEQRGARIEQAQSRFSMDDDEAKRYVAEQEELAKLKHEREESKRRDQEREQELVFSRQRDAFLADNSVDANLKELAKRFAIEVAEFSDNGRALDYRTSLNQIIGQHWPAIQAEQKAREDKIRLAAEQQTLKNVQARGAVKPETAGAAAANEAPPLSGMEREVARQMYPQLSQRQAEERYRQAKARLPKHKR